MCGNKKKTFLSKLEFKKNITPASSRVRFYIDWLVPVPLASLHNAAVCNRFFLMFPGSPITVERQAEPANEGRTPDPVDLPILEQ